MASEKHGYAIDPGTVLETLPGLILVTQSAGNIVYSNTAWREFTVTHDTSPDGWRESIHPDDLTGFTEAFARIVESGKAGEIEGRLRRADGEYRWHLFQISPLPTVETEDDRKWCWLVTNSDEGPAGEDRKPDGRLRRFMDMLPTQIVFMSPDLELEFVNKRVIEFYDRDLEQLRNYAAAPDTVNHPDDLPTIFEKLDRLVNHGEDWINQSRMLHRDGTYRWVGSEMVASRDAQGNIVRYCSVQTDVHELVQTRALLAGEVRILKMVALRTPLRDILSAVARLVEELGVGSCGILIINRDQDLFEYGGCSNLPPEFRRFFTGRRMSQVIAPFAHSALENSREDEIDLEHDPRWAATEWAALVRDHGFHFCWSIPVSSPSGDAAGVMAIYRRQRSQFRDEEESIIERVTTLIGIVIDRARADEDLRASEARLQRANAQLAQGERISATGSFTTDLWIDEQVWSDELYRVFDLPRETVPSLDAVRERVHPDDREFYESQIQRSQNGAPADFSFRISTSNGDIKYLHGIAEVVDHVEGRPIFMGVVQDITKIKLAEMALTAREAELRQAYSYLTEAQRLSRTGSFTWDVYADQHNWSDEIRRIFGFDLEVPITLPMIQAVIHPDDMDEVAKVIRGAFEGRDFDLIFRVRLEGGEIRFAHVVGHRIEQITERPVFLGALQDVTDSKVSEAALRASESELQRANSYLITAQRLSKTGSFSWHSGSGMANWSPEMETIFGSSLPVEGQPFGISIEIVHPEDRTVFDRLKRSALEGQNFDGEFRLLTPEGAVKNVQFVGHIREKTESGSLFVGAAQDVTALRQGEEALSRARAELAHVTRFTALSALTASITHEVSQPLAGILNNANTGLRMLAADPPDLAGVSDTISRTLRDTNRAAEVIKRLRAMFAKKDPVIELINLNDIAKEVIAITARELQRSRVVLQTNLSDEIPPVRGDRIQFQQVLLNLLLNAADAMALLEDEPRSLVVETTIDGEEVILSVKDRGVGLDAEAVEKAFNAFYTTKATGMGMGLSISKSIIESHKGRIWAVANSDRGATFFIAVPAVRQP